MQQSSYKALMDPKQYCEDKDEAALLRRAMRAQRLLYLVMLLLMFLPWLWIWLSGAIRR